MSQTKTMSYDCINYYFQYERVLMIRSLFFENCSNLLLFTYTQRQKQCVFLLSIFYGIVFCLCTSVRNWKDVSSFFFFFFKLYKWSSTFLLHTHRISLFRHLQNIISNYHTEFSMIYDTHMFMFTIQKKEEEKN